MLGVVNYPSDSIRCMNVNVFETYTYKMGAGQRHQYYN